jgi:hypothetical protein
VCPECGRVKGLHDRACPMLQEAWDALNPPPDFELEKKLRDLNYAVLVSIGFGQTPAGEFTFKVAANPVVRTLSPAQFERMVQALWGLYTTPLDDLEMR